MRNQFMCLAATLLTAGSAAAYNSGAETNAAVVRAVNNVHIELKLVNYFFFSSRRRHTSLQGDWSSDVCLPILSRRAAFGGRPNMWRRHRSLAVSPLEDL